MNKNPYIEEPKKDGIVPCKVSGKFKDKILESQSIIEKKNGIKLTFPEITRIIADEVVDIAKSVLLKKEKR